MCVCDYEPPQCFTERVRKARVPHTCCDCGDTIPAGKKYMRTTGIWDHHPDSHAQCLWCHALCRSLMRANGCYAYGNLVNDLEDHYQCWGDLFPAATQARYDGTHLRVRPW